MDFERIVRGAPSTLSMVFYGDSDPVDADGTVTITVTNRLGVKVVDGATASKGESTGLYTYNLAPQANLGMLTVAWTGAFAGVSTTVTGTVEVVGWRLFTLGDARRDPKLPASKFPDDVVRDRRIEVEDEFEEVCGRSFIPRLATDEFRTGTGTRVLFLSHKEPLAFVSIIEVDSDGVETDVTATVEPHLAVYWWGEVERTDFTVWSAYCRYRITYEYGPSVLDAEVRGAALRRVRSLLAAERSGIPERTDTYTADSAGQFRLASTLGRSGDMWITGIPDVDVVLNRKTLNSPVGGRR